MFSTAFPLALLLGLDGLIVAAALGPTRLGPRYRLALAGCFGLCDGLAVLLGAAVRDGWLAQAVGAVGGVGPLAVGSYGLCVLLLGWRSRAAADSIGRPAGRWLLFGLPVCLSLDNLVAGAGGGGADLPVTAAAGLSAAVSGLMAFAGLWAGE